jgi:hypothetical protein
LAHISAKVREKLVADPAVFLILDADSLAATVAAGADVAGATPVAREEGERIAFLLLESGCEYLKGDDFLLLPFAAPEA